MSAPSFRRQLSLSLMALLLLAAGTTHFWRPGPFVQIVPPLVPWPLLAVYVSGTAELVLGFALLVPRLSRLAAMGAALLFVAVFPANVYHWLGNVPVDGRLAPGWYHLIRLPAQGLLIFWAIWLSRRPHSASPPASA